MNKSVATETLTVERLREVLDYSPETGVFTWKFHPEWSVQLNAKCAGKQAGCVRVDGPLSYTVIRVDKTLYRGNRLAWMYINGRFPTKHIDHRNGVGTDDRYYNLREVDDTGNGANSAMKLNNTTGVTGVTFFRRDGTYMARVNRAGISYYLGYFKKKEDAEAAVIAKRAELGFSPTHGLTRERRAELGPEAVAA